MIEIICMVKLCRAIGRIVREKGRSAVGYQFLAVLLWIVAQGVGLDGVFD